MNYEELQDALKHLAGAVDTEDAAAALIRRLDADHDGEITVDSLERFLDRYAERLAKAEARASEDDESLPMLPIAKRSSSGSASSAGEGAAGTSGNESDGVGSESESEGEKSKRT